MLQIFQMKLLSSNSPGTLESLSAFARGVVNAIDSLLSFWLLAWWKEQCFRIICRKEAEPSSGTFQGRD